MKPSTKLSALYIHYYHFPDKKREMNQMEELIEKTDNDNSRN